MSGTEVGQLIAAVAAVIALAYTGRQLRQGRRLASQEMAYRYMERLSSPEFVPVLAKARGFWVLQEGDDEQARWDEWVGLKLEDKHKITLPMNVFEEMGAMFNQGLIDEGVVRRTMSSVAMQYWDEAHWLIHRYREADPDVEESEPLMEWGQMVETLRQPRRNPLGLDEPWGIGSLWGPSAEGWVR